jgi:N,N'-diacetylchitobiose transport system permease protein
MSAVESSVRETPRRRFGASRRNDELTPSGGTPSGRRRLVARWVPYALVSPSMLVLVLIIGFPLIFALVISFQDFNAFQLVTGGPVQWVGLKNYQEAITGDLVPVLVRTVLFTVTNVGLTMGIGFALALLMRRAGKWPRIFLSVSLVVVWAIPQVTATEIFQWLFDYAFGVVNWVLTQLHIGGFQYHDWWSNPVSLLGIATLIVVWGAVPFVSLTLFAGLLQIPDDLYEAARVDGAGFWSQLRAITVPLLAPILLLLTTLSILWDSRVFTQIYFLQQQGGIPSDTNLFGLWAYETSFAGQEYCKGAAISMLSAAILLIVTAVAVRQMVKSAATA